MLLSSKQKIAFFAVALTLTLATLLAPMPHTNAADHRDGPIFGPPPADITAVYSFLDPNDNSKLILGLGVHGFIVPGENGNAGVFDPNVRFRFELETGGDAVPDHFIEVAFSPRRNVDAPQVATIQLPFGAGFTALTTPSSATATTPPPPVITTDRNTGVALFAGLTDDPFFFDLPAGLRYQASRNAGNPDPSFFNRARDSFAGYNQMMIVLSVPLSLLRGYAGTTLGVSACALRRSMALRTAAGEQDFGPFVAIERMGVPTINAFLIPAARQDLYNRASTLDDAKGKFVADIVNTLRGLHTDDTSIEIIKRLAVTSGDMLRLNLSIPNSGPGGGNNEAAAFPNGRRPGDDVIDTVLTLLNNRVTQGDNVNGNDVPMRDAFPFFAPPAQPFPAGVIDDRTRN